MAVLNPDFTPIKKLHQPALEGELDLLHQLVSTLGEEY